jgi:hypothetical protein
VALGVAILAPAIAGLLVFYVLMRRRRPADEARAAWLRFAALWTPAAVAIAIVAELISH